MAFLYLKDAIPTSVTEPEKGKVRLVESPLAAQDIIKNINRGTPQIAITIGHMRSVASTNILAVLDPEFHSIANDPTVGS